MFNNTTGSYNVAFGESALNANTTASNNTAVGYSALDACTTAGANTAVGSGAGGSITTGGSNTTMGEASLSTCTTGQQNTAFGTNAGADVTTGNNNLLLGLNSGRSTSPSGSLTTGSNVICLGDNSITNAFVKVAWTVTSDARDKADITDSTYGLSFVQGLKPVHFKWDDRSNYVDFISDGSKKGSKTQLGFLAQDVVALEKAHGAVKGDLLVADDTKEEEILRITETKLIPVLVKAIQELKAEFDAYKATHP
jgi:hypothetical protein